MFPLSALSHVSAAPRRCNVYDFDGRHRVLSEEVQNRRLVPAVSSTLSKTLVHTSMPFTRLLSFLSPPPRLTLAAPSHHLLKLPQTIISRPLLKRSWPFTSKASKLSRTILVLPSWTFFAQRRHRLLTSILVELTTFVLLPSQPVHSARKVKKSISFVQTRSFLEQSSNMFQHVDALAAAVFACCNDLSLVRSSVSGSRSCLQSPSFF